MTPFLADLKFMIGKEKLPKAERLTHHELLAYSDFACDMIEIATALQSQGHQDYARKVMADVEAVVRPYAGQVYEVLAQFHIPEAKTVN